MAQIVVKNLVKEYRVLDGERGLWGSMKTLFRPKYRSITAIDHVDFSIEKGEIVGYIGPNGSGKSTTLKMLSGILYPTSGSITVNGLIPYQDRKQNAKQIGVVFGNRSQLYWDLPVIDSYQLNHRLYNIPDGIYQENLAYFKEIFDLDGIINQPVRLLSLGEKMRATIAGAMLHSPEILFLDEPTIGLDVTSKLKIRDFIKQINKKSGTTIILTSHDMGDIESLCERIILIDEGKKKYDGSVSDFENTFGGNYSISFKPVGALATQLPEGLTLKEADAPYYIVTGNKRQIKLSDAISIVNQIGIEELEIRSQTLEEIVNKYFE
ncbi:MAG: ATP-binding cassette domain-containing protein [Firmicutes bacterium]|nr:ATP-binding cassette domain-containing protein [Bacillota bacterium]